MVHKVLRFDLLDFLVARGGLTRCTIIRKPWVADKPILAPTSRLGNLLMQCRAGWHTGSPWHMGCGTYRIRREALRMEPSRQWWEGDT